jgi:hypothetical protein
VVHQVLLEHLVQRVQLEQAVHPEVVELLEVVVQAVHREHLAQVELLVEKVVDCLL